MKAGLGLGLVYEQNEPWLVLVAGGISKCQSRPTPSTLLPMHKNSFAYNFSTLRSTSCRNTWVTPGFTRRFAMIAAVKMAPILPGASGK